jgi:hypothetical protein
MTTQCELIVEPFTISQCAAKFDYGDTPLDDIEALEAHAERIRETIGQSRSKALQHALKVGEELVAAQERLAHNGDGTFVRWCWEACSLKKSTAYKLIDAYRFAQDCPSGGRSFEISALYALGAARCPEPARRKAIELADQGECITGSLATSLVRAHTPPSPDRVNSAVAVDSVDTSTPVPDPMADARTKLNAIVREFQNMQIGDEEIADLLRSEAERLLAEPDTTETINDEAEVDKPEKRPRSTSRSDANPDRQQDPPKSSSKGRQGKPRSANTLEELREIVRRAKAKKRVADRLSSDQPSHLRTAIRYNDVEYETLVDGSLVFYRIANSRDASWIEASGELKELIQNTWNSRSESSIVETPNAA